MAKRKKPEVAELLLDGGERQLLRDVFVNLQLPPTDLLLIGDGSGNLWDRACGWSAVLIECRTGRRRLFYGAMNFGSIEFAELMPYLQALTWHHRHQHDGTALQRVTIVTDSELLVQHSRQLLQYGGTAAPTLAPAFLLLRGFWELGYRITPVWYRRTALDLNTLSDLIAGLSRSQIIAAQDLQQMPDRFGWAERAAASLARLQVRHNGGELDIYDVNPGGPNGIHISTGQSQELHP